MHSVIRYPGSKARLADWIISHFPEHRSYLEPFFGSGAVLFRKMRSPIETVNDLDGDVINLFECIRRDPDRLAWEIYNTPYAVLSLSLETGRKGKSPPDCSRKIHRRRE